MPIKDAGYVPWWIRLPTTAYYAYRAARAKKRAAGQAWLAKRRGVKTVPLSGSTGAAVTYPDYRQSTKRKRTLPPRATKRRRFSEPTTPAPTTAPPTKRPTRRPTTPAPTTKMPPSRRRSVSARQKIIRQIARRALTYGKRRLQAVRYRRRS